MEDTDGNNQISEFLRELNRTLEDLHSKFLYYLRVDINSSTIKSLLELENRATTFLSPQDSIFSNLSHLKTLINDLGAYQYYTPRSLIQRGLISYKISGITQIIQKEIKLHFDREFIGNLIKVLQESSNEEEKLRVLEQFEDRISSGFDLELQDLILKAKLFAILESLLCNDSCPLSVREKSGSVITALALFNKNVFVGNVLMGHTIPSLILMGTSKSLQILTSLVKLIRGHLVNEMELNGEIPKIISLLSSENLQVRLMALNCLLEMTYFGRKKVIETMIKWGLIEKLMFLQRTNHAGDFSETSQVEEMENNEEDECWMNNNPFSGFIARFAIQVEVGEGLNKREKKEIKMEILRRVRAASVSEAEAATVVAEVLWGSHP